MLYCIILLSSCTNSRIAEAGKSKAGDVTFKARQPQDIDVATVSEQAYAQVSPEISSEDAPAAAQTNTNIDLSQVVHSPDIIRAPVGSTSVPVSTQEKKVASQQMAKKLSLPARMLMKSIVKKAEKLQKKDINNTAEQKQVNNRSYLILGILLLAAGLVLVLVGSTTLLYVLGSVASLAGLIFLLLAIL